MDRPHVVVTSNAFAETLDLLGERFQIIANASSEPWPTQQLQSHCAQAFGILAFMHDAIGDDFLAKCQNLRIIACALKGYDNFDVEACTRRGIWVTTVPDLLSNPTAELAVGLMIGLSRHIKEADRCVRSGLFRGWRPNYYGRTVDHSIVGLLGGGSIGQAIAQKLSGFSCQTLIFDEDPTGNLPGNARWTSFDDVVQTSDFLVLAIPLNRKTRHLVNSSLLRRMKPSCLLINPARGSLVDEAAVLTALEAGSLAGYAADVFEFEDRIYENGLGSIDPKFRALEDRTLFTAHIGSAVLDIRKQIEHDAALNIIEVWNGHPPHGAVNNVALQTSNNA